MILVIGKYHLSPTMWERLKCKIHSFIYFFHFSILKISGGKVQNFILDGQVLNRCLVKMVILSRQQWFKKFQINLLFCLFIYFLICCPSRAVLVSYNLSNQTYLYRILLVEFLQIEFL